MSVQLQSSQHLSWVMEGEEVRKGNPYTEKTKNEMKGK